MAIPALSARATTTSKTVRRPDPFVSMASGRAARLAKVALLSSTSQQGHAPSAVWAAFFTASASV